MADAKVAQELKSKMGMISPPKRRWALPDFHRGSQADKKSPNDSSIAHIYGSREGMAQDASVGTSLSLLKKELKAALSAELAEHHRQQTEVLERLLDPRDACTESFSLSLRERVMTSTLISNLTQVLRRESK